MSKLNIIPVTNPNDRLLLTHSIHSLESIERAVDFLREDRPEMTEAELELAERAVLAAKQERSAGFPVHTRIDFVYGLYMTAHYPIWNFLGKICKARQSGVVLNVITSDDYHVAVCRSLENGNNRGCLGSVAGFCKQTVSEGMPIGEYVRKCALEELSHEICVFEDDVKEFSFVAYVTDYCYQDVAIAAVRLKISKNQLFVRPRPQSSNTRTPHLSESQIFFARGDEMIRLVTDSRVRGDKSQFAALAISKCFKGKYINPEFVKEINRIPDHPPQEIYTGLPDLLDSYGIVNRTF